MKQLFILLCCSFSYPLISQVDYYPTNVKPCIEDYERQVDSLMKTGQEKEGLRIMFESVPDCIIGKTMPNYEFRDLNGNEVKLKNISSPIIFKMSASWCKPCLAEIPAINRIAEKFEGDLQVIVLFGDQQEEAEKIAVEYSDKIILIPSRKAHQGSDIKVGPFDHYIGYPASYYLNRNKKIIALTRGAAVPGAEDETGKVMSLKEANRINYERFLKKVREE